MNILRNCWALWTGAKLPIQLRVLSFEHRYEWPARFRSRELFEIQLCRFTQIFHSRLKCRALTDGADLGAVCYKKIALSMNGGRERADWHIQIV